MKTLEIKLENLTDAQAIAVEEMLAVWQSLSSIGSSRYVAFFADGDGNFHPKISVNGERPRYKAKELGIEFKEQRECKDAYWIDFDPIAWKLRESSDKSDQRAL